MSVVAFYGTGLLGSGFTRALLRRGETVHVWNRTHAKAKALEEAGAKAFDDPAEAARGAARVHMTLSDDAAVDEVLSRAQRGFEQGALVIDHTTTSPTGTAKRAAAMAEAKVEWLHCPVFMGPANALDGTGLMLAAGDPTRFERARPELEKMTGKLMYLGPDVDRAAKVKLLGNLFLIFMTAGMAEMMNLATAMGMTADDAAALFDAFNPGAMAPARARRMASGDYGNPSWELVMARKDARLMLEEAALHGKSLAMLPAIASVMDAFIARGHAHDDWTVIAKDAAGR